MRGRLVFPASTAPLPRETGVSVTFRIHPEARLSLKPLMVQTLQVAGGTAPERPIRSDPLPALVRIRNPGNTYCTPWATSAGVRAMPPGRGAICDAHGLIIDPFAFAAALDENRQENPTAFAAMDMTRGNLSEIAGLTPRGRFLHAIDLHGRPRQGDMPGIGNIGLHVRAPKNPWLVLAVSHGALYASSDPNAAPGAAPDPSRLLAAERNLRCEFSRLTRPVLARFSWHPTGRMTRAQLGPGQQTGARAPLRDTMRVVACDPELHLSGNLGAGPCDNVPPVDAISRAAPPAQIREGRPIT